MYDKETNLLILNMALGQLRRGKMPSTLILTLTPTLS